MFTHSVNRKWIFSHFTVSSLVHSPWWFSTQGYTTMCCKISTNFFWLVWRLHYVYISTREVRWVRLTGLSWPDLQAVTQDPLMNKRPWVRGVQGAIFLMSVLENVKDISTCATARDKRSLCYNQQDFTTQILRFSLLLTPEQKPQISISIGMCSRKSITYKSISVLQDLHFTSNIDWPKIMMCIHILKQ